MLYRKLRSPSNMNGILDLPLLLVTDKPPGCLPGKHRPDVRSTERQGSRSLPPAQPDRNPLHLAGGDPQRDIQDDSPQGRTGKAQPTAREHKAASSIPATPLRSVPQEIAHVRRCHSFDGILLSRGRWQPAQPRDACILSRRTQHGREHWRTELVNKLTGERASLHECDAHGPTRL